MAAEGFQGAVAEHGGGELFQGAATDIGQGAVLKGHDPVAVVLPENVLQGDVCLAEAQLQVPDAVDGAGEARVHAAVPDHGGEDVPESADVRAQLGLVHHDAEFPLTAEGEAAVDF